MTGIKIISPGQARMKINNMEDEGLIILDFRTPGEFQEGHIKYAKNTDFFSGNFSQELDRLDKEKTYLVYCRTMNRSMPAIDIMKKLGFEDVYLIDGGIMAWTSEGHPITISHD